MSQKWSDTDKPPLFFANYEATERIIVNQGGTSSGKTYTIVDILFILAMENPGWVLTVAGQDIPNLKAGAYRDAKSIYNKSSIYKQWFERPNETERLFKCINGSLIEFKSYSDEQDARSGKREVLFVNEAQGIPFSVYWQLQLRTYNKTFIDYNPSARFWVHDELIGKEDVKLIISDHRHNPFLAQAEHDRIESISDPELFKVYARGLTGRIEGLIYTNWDLVDSLPLEYKGRWIGIDFGYTDPTAIVEVRLYDGQLWIDEICYQSGMINTDIVKVLRENNLNNALIIADSASPTAIAELRASGFNVEPAEKGKDSIEAGIDILKRYKLNITRRSKHIKTEIQAYKIVERTGKPIDDFNHALDAIRYVARNKLSIKRKSKRPTAKTTSIM